MTNVDPAAAAPAAPSCLAEQPDESSAQRMVAICKRRVEILSERTEDAQVFINVDGTLTLEQSVEPRRVRKGSSWVPVDTTLARTSAGVVPQATVLPMNFSAGGNTLVGRLRDGDREISISWPSLLPAPELKGSTAVYADVLPGVDLQVTAQTTGFSEVLVVRSRKAAASPKLASLKFGLAAKGVAVRTTAGGGLEARDAKGTPVFAAPAPLMWDSSELAQPPMEQPATATNKNQAGERANIAEPPADRDKHDRDTPGTERQRRAVMPVKVDGSALTITPDRAMLADPRTKFPVFIDPSVNGYLVNNEWTSVWSKHPTSSFWKNTSALQNGSVYGSAGVGRTEDCTGCADHIIRSLFRLNISPVRGTQVKAAKFIIKQKHAWTCNPKSNAKVYLTGAFSAATTWNNQPVWVGTSPFTAQSPANHKVGSVHGCDGPGNVEFNVQPMVAHAAKNNQTSVNLGLRAVNEGTLLQWKRFDPSTAVLAIDYNRKPNPLSPMTSDGKDCSTNPNPYVLWPTPVLAGKQSDPDGGTLTTDFYWWPANGQRSETNKVTQSNGNGTVVSRAIPAGKLADGGTYIWQAKTSDGALSTWSGQCRFTVDSTPPPPPGPITSTDYSTTTFMGGVGIKGTFKIGKPNTTRPQEITSYVWTLDSGVLLAAKPATMNADRTGAVTTAPLHEGINTLRVWSKDHAGRYSTNPSTYTFLVRTGTGPAAEWTFDDADVAGKDVSEHGNTVTLGGSATRSAGRGGEGSALSLNGTTGFAATAAAPTYPHPDTGAATAVRTDSSFTVTARVRLTATGGTVQRTAVAASGSRTSAYTLGYSGPDNRWRFAMAGSDADSPTTFQILSNAAPVAGKWTHLAATYNAATKKLTLYVNGVAQTATATLTGGFNATGPVTIGKRKWTGADNGFLDGAVDDVRVYTFAETATNLAELAQPLQPAISLPNGSEVTVGGTAQVTFNAGGDTNVTKFRYSFAGDGLGSTANLATAGGSVTVSVPVGANPGEWPLYAVANDGTRDGPLTQAIIMVKSVGTRLDGTVVDSTSYSGVAGATVTLRPGGRTTTTDADGMYEFTDLTPGTYTVVASAGGRCGLGANQQRNVSTQGLTLELVLVRTSSSLGHVCAERTATFATGTTVLPLTGDNAVITMELPFAFPYYETAYRSAWVDTNGLLSFTDPLGSHPHTAGTALVSAAEPNAVIAPFWDDLVVDSAASVRTAATGSGTSQQVVVEWRNVYRKDNTAQRLSFSVTLAADGTVTTNYDGLDNSAEQGSNALVGLESVDGEDGIAYSSDEAALANGKAIVFTPPDLPGGFETHNLTGKLTNRSGQPVAGATIALDPSGLTTTTTADGSYTFYGLVADSYAITARKTGRCADTVDQQVELTADTTLDLRLAPDYGVMGYACTVGTVNYVAAGTVLPLTGDVAETEVTLPFPALFYGRSSTTATVSTDGWAAVGGGYLDALWSDLVIDSSASVRTQTIGTAPSRTFVIEWRNALFDGTSERSTFELALHEDGKVSYHYGAMSTDLQKGSGATVGLEDLTGTVTDFYSDQKPSLTPNSSITWTPAAAGAIGGVLTEAVTTTPIEGATITLNPGDRTTTTGADGSYQFTGMTPGAYQLTVSVGDNRCLGQYATVTVYKAGGDATKDLSLSDADNHYRCTTNAQPFITADTVQPWTGDDEAWHAVTPFPIKLYGETSSDVWVSSNGFVTLAPEGAADYAATPIPSGNADLTPNSAIYPFWADWVIDDQAAIATKVTGTAPNRQWIVEWRNALWFASDADRVSFEAIFAEDGSITFAYDGIDPDSPIERGSGGTVGIENTDGTVALQHLYATDLLTDGTGVHFQPDAPATNSISGSVTCAGNPVEGATVNAAGVTTTTAYDGIYQLDNIPAKTWTALASIPNGDCAGSQTRSVLVGRTAATIGFAAEPTPAGASYTITEAPMPYTAATGTDLLTGNDAWATVQLPFPIPFYGASTETLRIGTEGTLDLPAGYIYPFRRDWIADEQSDIVTAVRGSASDRQYVIEWRNLRHFNDSSVRFTFQAILDETGGISFVYPGNDGSYLNSGGMALIGIQPADGNAGLLYSDRLAVLRPGYGLRLTTAMP
ncbi:carboxypeptidase regulatory-like domain-containing protein [Paractinoplanes deccanensis]|uniref:carboxypeptidase regulatory-like domain-containing protein n=1 Tax=Paractinoplanes deccanensis TaxID=113561 RepID=UPI001EF267EA|nr:carboxypeptidase regulatory-like domain-containing protein [Actinoplanes deccanensis]